MRPLRFSINTAILTVPLLVVGAGSVRLVQRVFTYLNTGRRLAGTLSAEATRVLGRDVRIEDVHISGSFWSLTAKNQIELIGVSIANTQRPGAPAFVHADRIRVKYTLGQALAPERAHLPLVDEIAVAGPSAVIQRDAAGHWNFQDLIKPSGPSARPFTSRVVVTRGDIVYQDRHFPHAARVAGAPLYARLTGLTGIVSVRPNGSFAFDVKGEAPGYVRQLHAAGTASPSPIRIDARVEGTEARLPVLAGRAIAPQQLRVRSGAANLDIGVAYHPRPGIDPKTFDIESLSAHGVIQLIDVAADGSALQAPVERLNGFLTLTDSALLANVRGVYDGTTFVADGTLVGLPLSAFGRRDAASIAKQRANLSARINLQRLDWRRSVRLPILESLVVRAPKSVAAELRKSQLVGAATAAIEGPLAAPQVRFSAHADAVQYSSYRAKQVQVEGLFRDGRIRFSLAGGYADGEAVAGGTVSLSPPGEFDIRIAGRRLNLAHVGAPASLGLSGRGQVDFAIKGRHDRTPNIAAQAELDDVFVQQQPIRHAYARVTTHGPTLVIDAARADDPKGYVQAYGTVGLKSRILDVQIAGADLDFGVLKAALLTVGRKSAAPGRDVPAGEEQEPPWAAGLQGYGYAGAHLSGTLDNPVASGHLTALGVQIRDVKLNRVTVNSFVATRDSLYLDAEATRYPGAVYVAGRILKPFDPQPELDLTARAEKVELPLVLQAAGVDTGKVAVNGLLTTDSVAIRGPLTAPLTPEPVHAHLDEASINGLPLTSAVVSAQYTKGGIALQSSRVEAAGGAVEATGSIPFDGPIDVNIHAAGVQLQPIEEAVYAADPNSTPTIFRGVLALDAHAGGTLKKPVVTADSIRATGLEYGSFPIGSLQAKASYADGQARLEQVRQIGPAGDPDGVIRIDGLAYNTETKAIRTDVGKPIVFDAIPLDRLRKLAYSVVDLKQDAVRNALDQLSGITGPLTITAAIDGTSENPRADVTWKAGQVKLRNYEITSFSGSALVSRDRILYPSPSTPDMRVHIDSPYAQFDSPVAPEIRAIAIGLDREGRPGQISALPQPGVADTSSLQADAKLSNIRLDFLQNVLAPTSRVRVGGGGDLDIIASGPTAAPTLQFGMSLRNVAISDSANLRAAPVTLDRLRLENGVLSPTGATAQLTAIKTDAATGDPSRATAGLQFNGFQYTSPFLQPEWQFKLTSLDVPISFIAATAPGVLRHGSTGAFVGTAEFSDRNGARSLSGTLRLSDPEHNGARLLFASAATGLRGVDAALSLKNDRLFVDHFEGHTYINPRIVDKPLRPTDANPKKGAPAQPAEADLSEKELLGPDDPKRRGSGILVSGSLPIGLNDQRAVATNDGIFVRIQDTASASSVVQAARPGDRKSARVPYTFNEDPLPGGRSGVARGTLRTDPNQPLHILGAVVDPSVAGRIVLSNALLTPSGEQAAGAPPILFVPTFGLALALGDNVRLHTAQLDARLSTDRDISARGQLRGGLTGGAASFDPNDVNIEGTILVSEGKLRLPTGTFTILPGANLHVQYPTFQSIYSSGGASGAAEAIVGIDVDLKARGNIVATSQYGVRKRYEVTVTARGPVSDNSVDPLTGQSNFNLSFDTNPNDLASSQQALTERLAGAVIGVQSFDQAGRNPGQAFANVLSGVFTGSVLPGVFDRAAASLGFDELSLGYDPIDRVTLNISRHLFGPLYVSYYRGIGAVQERYDLKLSYRIKDRLQFSYDLDEQHTQKLLFEGVWKF